MIASGIFTTEHDEAVEQEKREREWKKKLSKNLRQKCSKFSQEWWVENVISRLQRQWRTTKRLYPVKCRIILLDFIPSQFNSENLLYILTARSCVDSSLGFGFFVAVAVAAVCWSLARLGHSRACSTCYFLSADLYTHTHTQVAHRKLFWTINKVNRKTEVSDVQLKTLNGMC